MYELDVPLLLIIILAVVVFSFAVLSFRKGRHESQLAAPRDWDNIYKHDK